MWVNDCAACGSGLFGTTRACRVTYSVASLALHLQSQTQPRPPRINRGPAGISIR